MFGSGYKQIWSHRMGIHTEVVLGPVSNWGGHPIIDLPPFQDLALEARAISS